MVGLESISMLNFLIIPFDCNFDGNEDGEGGDILQGSVYSQH